LEFWHPIGTETLIGNSGLVGHGVGHSRIPAARHSARDAHYGLRVSLDRPVARYRRALADDVPLADPHAGRW
jgi:hypothetical protein